MEKMPNLKIIARAGAGVDNINLDAATKRGIIVVNAPSGNTISTAEHSFAMMMALARKICQANNSIKSGEWNRSAFQGMELLGKIRYHWIWSWYGNCKTGKKLSEWKY